MDPVARYGEPVRISPLIKFCRWSALLLGITYGVTRNSYLQRKADRLKDLRDQRKAARLKFEAEEKLRLMKENQTELETALNTKFG